MDKELFDDLILSLNQAVEYSKGDMSKGRSVFLELPELEDIMLAKAERATGYAGRTADTVADDMERIISEVEHGIDCRQENANLY